MLYCSLVFAIWSPFQFHVNNSFTFYTRHTKTFVSSLLAPLGQYRSAHIQPSKGKRDRKKKHKASGTNPNELAPPAPELQPYVDVGLATVTRSLQKAASTGQHVKSSLEDGSTDREPATRIGPATATS